MINYSIKLQDIYLTPLIGLPEHFVHVCHWVYYTLAILNIIYDHYLYAWF